MELEGICYSKPQCMRKGRHCTVKGWCAETLSQDAQSHNLQTKPADLPRGWHNLRRKTPIHCGERWWLGARVGGGREGSRCRWMRNNTENLHPDLHLQNLNNLCIPVPRRTHTVQRQVVCYRKERVGEGPIRGSVQKQCGKDWKKHMTGE